MAQLTQTELTALTDDELLAEAKKSKSARTLNAALFGFMIGIAVFSTVKNGVGFFTFTPVIFGFLAFNNAKEVKALKAELQARNLK